MHRFSVWAPFARTAAVRIGDTSYPLHCGDGGWWHGDVEHAGPGIDYFYVLNDGKPVPDPRSGWQPLGVHGPSRIVDQSAFRWTDRLWQPMPLASGVVYELHTGTFTPGGTFKSAMERLDYLADLGVTHIDLMPVNEFSGDWGWGYDGVGLYAPHHAYGAPNDLKQFVDTCHAKGLAVLLDVVYNHFGPIGNYLHQFGPYFTEAYRTPWGPAVNFDHTGSREVRRFFLDNALMWLRDYHFDGLRIDAVHAIVDRSAIPILESISIEVDALAAELGKRFFVVAESDLNDPRVVAAREAGGLGADAQWSDDFHHSLHAVLTGEHNGYYEDFGSFTQLAKALGQVFVYDGIYSKHRGRLHGRPVPSRLSGHRFLGYSQTHDQVGNRARGERLAHLVSQGRGKIAAALVLTSPFIPMLFQGEEFGASSPFQYFTHHDDPEIGRLVSEGRRREFAAFGWDPAEIPDPQDPATFEASKLNWQELAEGPHAALLDWYKRLIALRRSTPALTDGRLDRVEAACDENAQWFVLSRSNVQIACNLAADRQPVPISGTPADTICSESGYRLDSGSIELPPDSVAICVERG
ncbi:MAG: malto-oligosyltrehalose trehalohydrolase [Bryobacteraceae bacterium]